MTYSLNTLNSTPPPRSLAARLGHEVTLVLGCLALLLWVLAMCSYSTQDAALSAAALFGKGPARTRILSPSLSVYEG